VGDDTAEGTCAPVVGTSRYSLRSKGPIDTENVSILLVVALYAFAKVLAVTILKPHAEAVQSLKCTKRVDAMNDEMDSITSKDTYEVVKRPRGRRVTLIR
jgi:hypothetical protein